MSEQRESGHTVVCPDAHDSDRRADRLCDIRGIGALEIILHQGPTDGYSLLNRCLVPGRSEKRRIRLWSEIPQPGTRLTKRWEDKKQVRTSPVPIEIFHRQPVEYNVQVGPRDQNSIQTSLFPVPDTLKSPVTAHHVHFVCFRATATEPLSHSHVDFIRPATMETLPRLL